MLGRSPRCRAAAAAAARFGSPSLRSTDGDVMVDGLRGEEEAVGQLGVGEAVGEQREHLELAGRETGGVGSGLLAWAAGDHLTGPAATSASGRCGSHGSGRGEQLDARPSVVDGLGVRQADALPPRAAEPLPYRCCPGPVAVGHSREGLGNARVRAGTSIPTVRRHQSSLRQLPRQEVVGGERVEEGQLPCGRVEVVGVQAASARATATGMMRWISPVDAARSRASSSRSSAGPVAAPERDGAGHDEGGYAGDRRHVRVAGSPPPRAASLPHTGPARASRPPATRACTGRQASRSRSEQ